MWQSIIQCSLILWTNTIAREHSLLHTICTAKWFSYVSKRLHTYTDEKDMCITASHLHQSRPGLPPPWQTVASHVAQQLRAVSAALYLLPVNTLLVTYECHVCILVRIGTVMPVVCCTGIELYMNQWNCSCVRWTDYTDMMCLILIFRIWVKSDSKMSE